MAEITFSCLTHAQIVVGAPDGDFAGIVGAVAEHRLGEGTGYALQVGEHAIAALVSQGVEGLFKGIAVVEHVRFSPWIARGPAQPMPEHWDLDYTRDTALKRCPNSPEPVISIFLADEREPHLPPASAINQFARSRLENIDWQG